MKHEIIILHPESITIENEREWAHNPEQIPLNVFRFCCNKLVSARLYYTELSEMLHNVFDD